MKMIPCFQLTALPVLAGAALLLGLTSCADPMLGGYGYDFGYAPSPFGFAPPPRSFGFAPPAPAPRPSFSDVLRSPDVRLAPRPLPPMPPAAPRRSLADATLTPPSHIAPGALERVLPPPAPRPGLGDRLRIDERVVLDPSRLPPLPPRP